MGRKTVAVAVLLVHCVNRQMIVMHKTQTRNELMPLNASNCSPMYSDNPDACAQVLKYLYFKKVRLLLSSTIDKRELMMYYKTNWFNGKELLCRLVSVCLSVCPQKLAIKKFSTEYPSSSFQKYISLNT